MRRLWDVRQWCQEVEMADKLRVEIGGELAPILLRLAREQGRGPDEITEEALLLYLRELKAEPGPDTADIGKPIETIYVQPPGRMGGVNSFAELFERVERWQRERGVEPPSDEEAMRIAVEEQHASRSGREARR